MRVLGLGLILMLLGTAVMGATPDHAEEAVGATPDHAEEAVELETLADAAKEPAAPSVPEPLLELRGMWTEVDGYELILTKEDYVISESTPGIRYAIARKNSDVEGLARPYISMTGLQGSNKGMRMVYRPDMHEAGVRVRQGEAAMIQSIPPADARVFLIFETPMERWVDWIINELLIKSKTVEIEFVVDTLQTGFAKWVNRQLTRLDIDAVDPEQEIKGVRVTVREPYPSMQVGTVQMAELYLRPGDDGLTYPVRLELYGTKSVKKGGISCAMDPVFNQLLYRFTWSHIRVYDDMPKELFDF